VTTVAIDWDHTLVENGDWLPGAERALLGLRRHGYRLAIHSSRALHPEGKVQIAGKLGTLGFREGEVEIMAKPNAIVYIDDRGYRFAGDWAAALRHIRTLEGR